jgi:hypothetical protein
MVAPFGLPVAQTSPAAALLAAHAAAADVTWLSLTVVSAVPSCGSGHSAKSSPAHVAHVTDVTTVTHVTLTAV